MAISDENNLAVQAYDDEESTGDSRRLIAMSASIPEPTQVFHGRFTYGCSGCSVYDQPAYRFVLAREEELEARLVARLADIEVEHFMATGCLGSLRRLQLLVMRGED